MYGHPAWVNGVVARTPRAATLRAVNVPSHQWVEMRVVFPRRVLTSTTGAKVVHGNGLAAIIQQEAAAQASYRHDREQLDDAKNHPGRTLLYLALFALGPALAVLFLMRQLFEAVLAQGDVLLRVGPIRPFLVASGRDRSRG